MQNRCLSAPRCGGCRQGCKMVTSGCFCFPHTRGARVPRTTLSLVERPGAERLAREFVRTDRLLLKEFRERSAGRSVRYFAKSMAALPAHLPCGLRSEAQAMDDSPGCCVAAASATATITRRRRGRRRGAQCLSEQGGPPPGEWARAQTATARCIAEC